MTHTLLDLLGIDLPIIQAPMAGTSSPALAAAVANAGGLGSIGVGATSGAGARKMIAEIRERTNRSFNVTVFCHRPATPNETVEKAWIERLRPAFRALGAEPPAALTEIYKSFVEDDDMLAALLAEKPKVVSFHFGLPSAERIRALLDAGIVLLGSATNPQEGQLLAAAGLHAVVGQGYEAGGHRGAFDENAEDARLGTMTLTRLLVRTLDIPVIAAGGIMDGAGIAAAMTLGASAAQLGTAFIGCPESLADDGYRKALMSASAHRTTMTRVISGRPARSLANRFTALGADIPVEAVPAYPIAYDLGKALNAAGKAAGDYGFGAQWAGQGAPLARALPAAELVALLAEEMKAATSSREE
jgi:nitronate monooxygenase